MRVDRGAVNQAPLARVYRTLDRLGRWLAPVRCALCAAPGCSGLSLCRDCLEELPRHRAACRLCRAPLPSPSPHPCGRCISRPPRFDAVQAPLAYGPPVDALVHRFKFSGELACGRLLAELMLRPGEPRPDAPDLLLPVPLHPRRRRERGFNQAEELARHLGRALAVPVERRVLCRDRAGPSQAGLKARQRRANLARAFSVRKSLAGARVVLVDDVMTTGTTANRCAAVLKSAGAGQVQVWVAARA